MGEDSDPKTGSDAVDDPRDDESEQSGDRTPDADTADADVTADGDARSPADSDGTETAADGDDDSAVAADDDAADVAADADTGDDAADTNTGDDAADADAPPEATAVADPVAVDDAPSDASGDDASPDESLPADDDIEPVAEAVPDPGAPDDSPPDAADTADSMGPVDPPPPNPDPDVTDGPGSEGPAPDEHAPFPEADEEPFPEADEEPFPEADEDDTVPTADADAGANVHPSHSEAERDLTPVSEDSVDHADVGAGFGDEDSDDVGVVGEGPAEDEEMPLADHIEEMMRRLGVVFLIGGVVLIAAYPASDRVVNFLWNAHIPGAADPTSPRRPRLYGPLELVLTELKVAGLAGFIAGLPALVYQSYRFMRPGLYPKERRYYLASVPTSLVLALVGVAFAHFIVLPAIFAYFTSYTANAEIVVAFGLRETFNLILLLMGYMALVFQIPLFMMLAVMMGLVTRQWMTDKRLLFWGAFLGLSFLVSPDPTGMTPIIVAATMIALFEGTLLLIKWTGR